MINRRSQRGVFIALTPVLLTLIVILLTLVIDSARLLSIRSDMQSQVNAAATAAADAAQSCGGESGDLSEMQARGLSAARAVGFDGDESDLDVAAGLLAPDQENTDSLRFSQKADILQTNAALVTYTRTEPLSRLLPESLFSPVELSVDAAARKEVVAILSATGSTASIEDGILGQLIEELTGVSEVDATNLESLESTVVSVGDLLDELGVSDLTALADEPLLDVLEAVTTVVGEAGSPAGSVIDDLTSATGLNGLDAGAVFDVVSGISVSEDSSFPLYDFVNSIVLNSVRAANQSGAGLLQLELEDTEDLFDASGLDLLGDVEITLDLMVDEPPRIVFGPARQDEAGDWLTNVRAADISLQANIDVGLATGELTSLVDTLSAGLVGVSVLDDIRIPLAVQAGGGEADLIAADCARGDNNTVNLDFDTQGSVVAIETGTIDTSTGAVVPDSLNATILRLDAPLLPAVETCVRGDLSVSLPHQSGVQEALQYYSLHCPDGDCDEETLTDSSTGSLGGLSVNLSNLSLQCESGGAISGVLNTVLSGLSAPVTDLVEGVTGVVLESAVSPLLTSLGADLGGASVKVIGASQQSTQLIENVEQ
ncbi:MAG: Tad secretion system protein [Marinobacter sp. HL-58]|nr:MAG: Tad secretion system protein [Marinobacter sp. HL-58]